MKSKRSLAGGAVVVVTPQRICDKPRS